jgi:biopolymer transport protein ExbD
MARLFNNSRTIDSPHPEIHLRADGEVACRRVARGMSDAAKYGLTRIGFVTDPNETR